MESINSLISEFARLPGIGRKSASRLAYHLMLSDEAVSEKLAETILEARHSVKICSVCHNISDQDPCSICQDTRREKSVICVVAEPKDLLAIERTRQFHGLYHVLGGLISPMSGVGPDDIKISSLMSRLSDQTVSEVILALNFSVEGETTAMYISRMTNLLGVKTTRIAKGLPAGADLEYTDESTLANALDARKTL